MSDPVDAALAIGRRLARQALWHEGRCSWLSPVPAVRRGHGSTAIRALPPDLYGGTAGVALALAELADATGDRLCRRTALGAARHAAAHRWSVRPVMRAGFHAGRPGIALCLVRAGRLIGAEEVAAIGRADALELERTIADAAAADLIGGRAGGVIGMLALGAALDASGPTDVAVRLGDALIARARREEAWYWGSSDPSGGLDVSGLAHGPSGAALAMLELAVATREARFARAAAEAVASEDEWRDPETGNWLERPARTAPEVQRSFVTWCHGAPGIGLARRRAWQIGGDPRRGEEAVAASRLTARFVRGTLETGRGDFGLCHGLAGNAEVLRRMAPATGDPDARGLVADVLQHGIDEYVRPGRPFPCGPLSRESPSLMLGLAGIARFYLGAGVSALPSVLQPCPAEWGAPSRHGTSATAEQPARTPATVSSIEP